MFESVAYAMGAPGGGAAGAGASGGAGAFQSLFPLIIIFGIFYFLLIRPQQKKQKEHKTMLDALKKGDHVITSGGIYGTIFAITPNTVTLIVAEGVRLKVGRGFISDIAAPEDEGEKQ